MIVKQDFGEVGNSELTKTILWTNPSPSSTFPNSTLTLSETINNYKYIGFEYKVSTVNSKSITLVFSVSDFKKSYGTTSTLIYLGSTDGNYNGFVRYMMYANDTSLNASYAMRTLNSSTDNNYCIPLYVYGIN